MKISPIASVNYGIKINQNQVRSTKKYSAEPSDAVCFKGIEGAKFGAAVEFLVGAVAIVVTGGLLAPVVGAAAGATAGAVAEDAEDD